MLQSQYSNSDIKLQPSNRNAAIAIELWKASNSTQLSQRRYCNATIATLQSQRSNRNVAIVPQLSRGSYHNAAIAT
jgi:hypothetical protein